MKTRVQGIRDGRPTSQAGGKMTRRPVVSAALAIVLAALATLLRAHGIGFGLPAVYNPDEVAIMSRALAFGTGSRNPHNFLYPSLYFYVLFGWVGLWFLGALATGATASLAAFRESLFVDPTVIYLAGRWLGVACGTITVLATWRLGTRVGGGAAGAVAAALLAVSPFAVRDAHYVKHDVPATLAIVAAMLMIWRVTDATAATLRRTAAAGLVCGLAISVHYYAVFILVPLTFAVLWKAADTRARAASTLAVAYGSAAAGFFLGTPFIVAEPVRAFGDIVANRQIVVDRALHTSDAWFPSAGAYASMLWSDAVGPPVAALALGGAAVLFRQSTRSAVLLLAFPAAFFAFISNTVAATRYLNPMLPFVAVLAACAITALAARVRRTTARGALVVALTALAAAPGLAASIDVGRFFSREDTRTIALRYIEQHVPPGSGVALQPYSVPLAPTRDSVIRALRANLGDERKASAKFRVQLGVKRWPEPSYDLVWLGSGGLDADKIYVEYADRDGSAVMDELAQRGIEYVILKGGRSLSPAAASLDAALHRRAVRVFVASPYPPGRDPSMLGVPDPFIHNTDARIVPGLERPGPVIEVWRVPPSR
jgi:hypothetical protein